jgi:hypothetical protein
MLISKPLTVFVPMTIELGDEEVDVSVKAMVSPPQRATRDDPATDWTVEVLDITNEDGSAVSDAVWGFIESQIDRDPSEFAEAFEDRDAECADYAAEDRRERAVE